MHKSQPRCQFTIIGGCVSCTVKCAPATEDFTPPTQAYVPISGFWTTLGQAVDQTRALFMYQAEQVAATVLKTAKSLFIQQYY